MKGRAIDALVEQILFAPEIGEEPALEYRFHPGRKWRFDIAFPQRKIAIEYEGIMTGKSRHTTITGFARDCEKYNEAVIAGWRVLRFTYDDVRSGKALDALIRLINRQGGKHE